ncbi:MAG TPA: hypothetical protein VHO01_06220, partial [Jatrophihabitans sp.]|nr:hypothetical protein [Jatrophihabitans sp.]
MTLMIAAAAAAPVLDVATADGTSDSANGQSGTSFATVLAGATAGDPAASGAGGTCDSGQSNAARSEAGNSGDPVPANATAGPRASAPGHRSRPAADRTGADPAQAAADPSSLDPATVADLAGLVPMVPVVSPPAGSWQAGAAARP